MQPHKCISKIFAVVKTRLSCPGFFHTRANQFYFNPLIFSRYSIVVHYGNILQRSFSMLCIPNIVLIMTNIKPGQVSIFAILSKKPINRLCKVKKSLCLHDPFIEVLAVFKVMPVYSYCISSYLYPHQNYFNQVDIQ